MASVDELFADPSRATLAYGLSSGARILDGDDGISLAVVSTGVSVVGSRRDIETAFRFQTSRVLRDVVKLVPGAEGRKSAARFLESCIDCGLLVPTDENGDVVVADVQGVAVRFAGAPSFRTSEPAPFVFLGVPWDFTTTGLPGTRFGPSSIRMSSQSLAYQLDFVAFEPMGFHDYAHGKKRLVGIPLADAGDVVVAPGENLAAVFPRITRVVGSVRKAGSIPLVLGGDHAIAFATLAAFAPKPIAVLHVDAHTDLGEITSTTNPASTTNPSSTDSDRKGVGPYADLHHGNVMSAVLDRLPHVEHIVQVGLRGIIEAGAHRARERATAFGMHRFRTEGVSAVVAALPAHLPVYISYDIDGLDPTCAPTTGTPVPGGLFPHEVSALFSEVAKHRRVIGMEVVEVGRALLESDGTAFHAVDAFLTVADGIAERFRSMLALQNG